MCVHGCVCVGVFLCVGASDVRMSVLVWVCVSIWPDPMQRPQLRPVAKLFSKITNVEF